MNGINRALKDGDKLKKAWRDLTEVKTEQVPCVFISYQRKDEKYAGDVANYIMSKKIDVYFDLEDNDLKKQNQRTDPKKVTEAIKKGLNRSDYMLVVVSPDTYRSLWVPFEVGYAYDKKGDKMKLLRHKGIDKETMPAYLKVKELLNGITPLDKFLLHIRKGYTLYESLLKKGEEVKVFSAYSSNPLNQYLDNE